MNTRRILLAVGIVLLALWAVKLFLGGVDRLPSFDGQRFNDPAYSAEARAALTEARAVRDFLAGRSRWWSDFAFWLGMIGLGLTSIATVVAAWRRARDGTSSDEVLNRKLTSIGLLCAFASVSNLAHDRVSSTAESLQDDSRKLAAHIARAGDELKAAPDDQAAIIDSLRAELVLVRP